MPKSPAAPRKTSKKRKLALPPGQLTLAQSWRRQVRARPVLLVPHTNPAHAFWSIPHLQKLLFEWLPRRKVAELLQLDRSALREGAAVIYRHLDLSDGSRAGHRKIGDADHGLTRYAENDEEVEVNDKDPTNKHLIIAAQHRQTLYRQSVITLHTYTTQDVPHVYNLLTKYPNLTEITDGIRRVDMPTKTFHQSLGIFTPTAIAWVQPASPFPDDWQFETRVSLAIGGTPLYATAAAMVTDGQPVAQVIRNGSLFQGVVSLTLTVYVPRADFAASIKLAPCLSALNVLPDPTPIATLGLLRQCAGSIESFTVSPHPLFRSAVSMESLFSRDALQHMATFLQLTMTIAPPAKLDVCLRNNLAYQHLVCQAVTLIVDNCHQPGVLPPLSLLAMWARSIGQTARLSYESAAGKHGDHAESIAAEQGLLNDVHWGPSTTIGLHCH